MLSATYSLEDLKYIFESDNVVYDLTLEPLGFERAFNEAKLKYMYPFIGETSYDTIADLDKTGLSLEQEYLYMAELYFAAYFFVKGLSISEDIGRAGDSHSISIEGYSESITGVSGKKKVAGHYFTEGISYLSLAGYQPMRLRRC